MKELKKHIFDDVIKSQSDIDHITISLMIFVFFAQVLVGYYQYIGQLSFFSSLILSCVFMNMSFTLWHECSHGNLSRYKALNDLCGIISSFFSFFPGYYARKREHLIHHKYEGDSERDPVYQRIQNTTTLRFIFTALISNYFSDKKVNAEEKSYMPLTNKQKLIDKITVLSAWCLVVLFLLTGRYDMSLSLLIIPRVFIFVFHGYVICFFPHYISPGKGYRKYRVRDGNFILKMLTMNQNYHGIHHFYPAIRWYNYPKVFKTYKDNLEQNNIEVMSKSEIV